MNADELIENFSYLLDWEDKYRYLIELGEKMESLPENERTEDLKVDGCQSQVWIKGEKKEDKFYFQAASDAIIVQGLEAVLLSFVNGKTAQEIQNLDLLGLFKNLGLEENISPTRRNGFASMVQRIYDLTKTPNL
ncbi:MAG: SufE family protein [Alphaproteobacteria bacterium]|nr:SufE family protein [Alphaproteobacteria bacterium]